jgi:hypothetical protein|tara:strand:+ start:75 stop:374 length:300 start_codon:yes stop_codon:yes gene_type:complete
MPRNRKESFYRILNKRLLKLQSSFRSVRRLANKSNYIFNQDDVDRIVKIVEGELGLLKTVYFEELDPSKNLNNLRDSHIPFEPFITIEGLEKNKKLGDT